MDLPVSPSSSNLKKSPAPPVVKPQPALGTNLAFRAESFSGPLPPPDLLEAYERTSSGLADRIVKMAEAEQAHRHRYEAHELSWVYWLQMVGLVMGGGLAIAGLFLGAWLVYHDKTLAGFTLFLGALGGLLGTAIYKHRQGKTPPPV
ncbi:MAG: DUF2335 domain-containing protein [Opitutus sp.]|nr:DUF2335 domain-containing protein [Opitutus sp.]MCS6275579.1 DUF2335 domain-containing protein [Opitutus sp.]